MIENKFKEKKGNKVANDKRIAVKIALGITLVTTLIYFVYTIMTSSNIVGQLTSIIGVALISIFAIFFLFIGIQGEKKQDKFIIIASFLLTSYSSFNLLTSANILKLPSQDVVSNFTYKTLTEALQWSKSNNIELVQVFENSDTVEAYHIINQNVEPGTLLKNVKTMTVVVSNGPSLEKDVLIPNMVGWNADDVLMFIKKNYLSNVEVVFQYSSQVKDTVINQEGSGELKRSDKIILTFSLGEEGNLEPIKMTDLSKLSLFEATFYLKRHGIDYELAYDYHDTIEKNYIISQSVAKNETVIPFETKVLLTVSKGARIVVPDLYQMSIEKITQWASDHKLRLQFEDRYDDSKDVGMPLEVNVNKDDVIEEGTMIKVVVSKGKLVMQNFSSLQEFKEWAMKYNITYQENYEFNQDYEIGKIIKFSHQNGQTIKNDDTVTVTISQGSPVTVPKFIGKTKSDIQKECNNLGITCTFIYGGYTDSIKKDVATNQSKAAGGNIVRGTSISITLSSGIIEKVKVPNFLGKSRNEIESQCNANNLKCNFSYQNGFNDNVAKDHAVSQSINANTTVNAGTTINITLSNGGAARYNVVIQQTYFTAGNPEQSKSTLLSKLQSACPGVNFNIEFKTVNTGAGLIHPDSPTKVGANTFIQGKTYTIIIGSY